MPASEVDGAMARSTQPPEVDWTAVIARALAFLCVRQAQLEGETLVEQANFLERFGIPRAEAAQILGTTQKSLTEMDRQQRGRQAKSGAKKTVSKKKVSTGRKSRG